MRLWSAQGWSTYAVELLDQLGVTWPESLGPGATFNLLSFLLIAALTVLITIGIKESMRVNLVLVAIKLFVVLFVIVMGIGLIHGSNYNDFVPAQIPAGDTGVSLDHDGVAGDHRRRPGSTDGAASSPAPRSSSSPSSASTWWRRPPRRPRSRSATCRSASSARW